MADYDITKMVDAPPAGFARVEAFFTAKGDAVYAIVPRRPREAFAFESIPPASDVKVTLLPDGRPLETGRLGDRLTVIVPDALSAALPASPAYTFKITGLR